MRFVQLTREDGRRIDIQVEAIELVEETPLLDSAQMGSGILLRTNDTRIVRDSIATVMYQLLTL